MKKRKEFRTYQYACAVTGEEFTLNREAKDAGELVTVKAYYELHPDKDDRPAHIKKQLGLEEAHKATMAQLAPTTDSES